MKVKDKHQIQIKYLVSSRAQSSGPNNFKYNHTPIYSANNVTSKSKKH